jgi:hypothetical protein
MKTGEKKEKKRSGWFFFSVTLTEGWANGDILREPQLVALRVRPAREGGIDWMFVCLFVGSPLIKYSVTGLWQV